MTKGYVVFAAVVSVVLVIALAVVALALDRSASKPPVTNSFESVSMSLPTNSDPSEDLSQQVIAPQSVGQSVQVAR